MEDKKHTWSLVDRDGEKIGLYHGASPSVVAKKMVKMMHRDEPNKTHFRFRFVKNDYGKSPVYEYEGLVKKLKNPIIKTFPNGNNIEIFNEIIVRKLL
jgi:hypothetical protein